MSVPQIVREFVGGSWRTREESSSGGGSQPGIRVAVVEFVEEATGGTSFAIINADSGTGTIKIAGDHVAYFNAIPATAQAIQNFQIVGSTLNDGSYSLTSVTLNGGNTDIVLTQGLADDTADGDFVTPGIYTTDPIAIAAGTRLLDIALRPGEAGWAADSATITAGDTLTGPTAVFDNEDVKSLAYPLADLQAPTFAFGTQMSSLFTTGDTYGEISAFFNSGGNGGGWLYADDDELVIFITTVLTSSPVVPTGRMLAEIWTLPPIVPQAATRLVPS